MDDENENKKICNCETVREKESQKKRPECTPCVENRKRKLQDDCCNKGIVDDGAETSNRKECPIKTFNFDENQKIYQQYDVCRETKNQCSNESPNFNKGQNEREYPIQTINYNTEEENLCAMTRQKHEVNEIEYIYDQTTMREDHNLEVQISTNISNADICAATRMIHDKHSSTEIRHHHHRKDVKDDICAKTRLQREEKQPNICDQTRLQEKCQQKKQNVGGDKCAETRMKHEKYHYDKLTKKTSACKGIPQECKGNPNKCIGIPKIKPENTCVKEKIEPKCMKDEDTAAKVCSKKCPGTKKKGDLKKIVKELEKMSKPDVCADTRMTREAIVRREFIKCWKPIAKIFGVGLIICLFIAGFGLLYNE